MKGLTKLLMVLATGTWSWVSTLHAHEFIIKPKQLRVEGGARLPFNILATHFFMISEEVEPVNTVKAWFVEGEKRTAIELKENHTAADIGWRCATQPQGTALRGSVKPTMISTYLLAMSLPVFLRAPVRIGIVANA